MEINVHYKYNIIDLALLERLFSKIMVIMMDCLDMIHFFYDGELGNFMWKFFIV